MEDIVSALGQFPKFPFKLSFRKAFSFKTKSKLCTSKASPSISALVFLYTLAYKTQVVPYFTDHTLNNKAGFGVLVFASDAR